MQVRHHVLVCYCNEALGASHDGRLQGGSSRVIAPDGRDIAFCPDMVAEGLIYAPLGTRLQVGAEPRHRPRPAV